MFDPCFFDIVAARLELDDALRNSRSDSKDASASFVISRYGHSGGGVFDANDNAREKPSKHAFKCAVCDSTAGLRACSRCRKIHYCSPEHQKAHWKIHKAECSVKLSEAHLDFP